MDTFIGIDLAWSERNDSGVAVLHATSERADELRCEECALVRGQAALEAWLTPHLTGAGRVVIMVDAPLVVPNETGRRPCEAALARCFAAHHAAPYPGNRRLLGARQSGGRPRGEVLGEWLGTHGFEWPPQPLRATLEAHARVVHECYPHPAHVRLFGLERTFRYKKKRGRDWPLLREQFARYGLAMRGLRTPAIRWSAELEARFDVRTSKGVAYKRAEDQLDALCCAYLAALTSWARLEAFGDPATGMIVVPSR